MKTTNHPSVRTNHAHKKTALAGAASKMISNSAHLTIGDCLRGVFDGEKPSRQNRRFTGPVLAVRLARFFARRAAA
jgi:hypothetical protein